MALNLDELGLLSRLFDEASTLPPAQQEPWLQSLPGTQRHLAARLRRMLAGQARHTGALAGLPPLEPGAPARAGERVGPWRLVREIGRGGMGSVWLAERADGAYERRVALKLPRIAWAEDLAPRMARERRIGALLEHPAIARLYDAGLDERGRPYLAMEYVDGVPIDRHCADAGLDRRAIVALCLQVVHALAYAHGRLVVHRDLKPGNVLVDAGGRAHLLDFGIAKLLQDDDAADAQLTLEQGRPATPLYAAPEQLQGGPATVQADIYGLGVMLHELLTGALPQAHAPSPELRGDLGAVLAKALQEDPARRYASADALAADLTHWLQGDPVGARPDPAWYRLARLLRRHRVAAAGIAGVVLALGLGGGIALLQSLRAQQAAQREQAVRDFVAEVLRVPAPRAPAPGELTSAPAEAFLERSASLVEQRLQGQPALQAELYATMGQNFADMGAHRLAAEYARRRIAALAAASADDRQRARAALQLAGALLGQLSVPAAQAQARAALALARDDPGLAREAEILLARALAAGDRHAETATLLDRIEAAAPGGQAAGTATSWVRALRGWLAFRAGRLDQALPLLDRAIALAHAVEGPDSMAAIEQQLMAATILATTTKRAETDRYFIAAEHSLQRQGGHHATRAALVAAEFAATRLRSGHQMPAAESLAAIARARALLATSGAALPAEVSARLDRAQATALIWSGRVDLGLPLIERAMAVLYADAPSVSERRLMAVAYALALRDIGDHQRADHWLREVLRMRIDSVGADHPYAALDLVNVAHNLGMAGRTADALAVLDGAPAYREAIGDGARHPQRIRLRLLLERSRLLLDSGALNQALEVFPRALLDEPADRPDALPVWGELLCRGSDVRRGRATLDAALQAQQQRGESPESPWWAWQQATAGECALRAGDRAAAVQAARVARRILAAWPQSSPFFRRPLERLEAALARRG